jgi:hypothetical protein
VAFPLFFAYIDPGAGSLVIQALIAALISVPFVFRSGVARVTRRARSLFRGRDHGATSADDTETTA